jgi:hypothetical protein
MVQSKETITKINPITNTDNKKKIGLMLVAPIRFINTLDLNSIMVDGITKNPTPKALMAPYEPTNECKVLVLSVPIALDVYKFPSRNNIKIGNTKTKNGTAAPLM